MSNQQLAIGAMIYGAARQKVSNALIPVTSKIPLGAYTDEAVLGGLAWYGSKKIKNKTLKAILRAALVVEAARVGQRVINTQTATTNNNTVTIGR